MLIHVPLVVVGVALVAVPFSGCDSSSLSGRYGGVPGLGQGNTSTADDCDRVIGPETVDNVNVPDGATCTLDGTRVRGNVFVRSDAHLVVLDAYVGGNVQAEDAFRVEVHAGTFVGGNVQVKQGGATTIENTDVDGDVQLEQNFGPQSVDDTSVRGNMQVNENRGGVFLYGNSIRENLQCQANYPPPEGAGNTAGDMEDQCEFL